MESKEVVLVRVGSFNHCLKSEDDPVGARSSRGQILRAGEFGNILTVDINTGGSELVPIIRGQ